MQQRFISKNGNVMQSVFVCIFCKTKYGTKRLQEKCMKWCKDHPNECNQELMDFALEERDDEQK